MIVTVASIVLFAAGGAAYAVTRHSTTSTAAPYLTELSDAKQITGVTFRTEPDRNHVSGS